MDAYISVRLGIIFSADVYRKFIERLSDVYKRRLAVLEYIPGSFTAKQAQQMLGI